LDFGARRALFFSREGFFGLAFLACSLLADRGFRTTDFAADLFFFFDLAMVTVVSAISNRLAQGKWTLN
jgi:hypothetical protein